MVTWLTEDFGVVATPVRGACRPKSFFLGQYDLFYTCALSFYERGRDGVHAIRECVPLELREPLRGRWRAAAAAGYLADLTARAPATACRQESRALFALLSAALDRLCAPVPADLPALLLWYEARLLLLLGLAPDFALCPTCHPPERAWLRFSLASGRFVCPHLARPLPGEAAVAVHRSARSAFLRLLRSPAAPPPALLPGPAGGEKNFGAAANPLLGLSRFLGMFIHFHLDMPPAVRRVAWEMVWEKPAMGAGKQEKRLS